jgi:hypothetical protein
VCPGLSKVAVGELLGDPDPFCLRILDAFTATFDFAPLAFDAALRAYVDSFKLPGEAQKIDRIINCERREKGERGRERTAALFLCLLCLCFTQQCLPFAVVVVISARPFCFSKRYTNQPTHPPPPFQNNNNNAPPRPPYTGFGRHYHRAAAPQGLFANDDACYVLAYAVIMLNTDLHNSQARVFGWGVCHRVTISGSDHRHNPTPSTHSIHYHRPT